MPYELITIPCLQDNYAFLLQDSESGEVALIDIPEAGPIKAELSQRGWKLNQIWITHHHSDHVDGLAAVLEDYPATVLGAAADSGRLPPLDRQVKDGETFQLGNLDVHVLDVSGHTIGHIAFHVPGAKACFTADSLMAMGCGRLFEGTPDQMWESLCKLKALPPETLICSGHEYTESNAKFALTVDPANKALTLRIEEIERARAAGEPTVPSRLSLELETNPFLRAADPAIRAALELQTATDAEVFAEIRRRKDTF